MKDDDLFQETSMSFGEHLEELRRCLFYSLYAIALGSCLGFLVGHKVVQYIQIPVEKSLASYSETQSQRKIEEQAAELEQNGYSKDLVSILRKDELVAEERWIFPQELYKLYKITGVQPSSQDEKSSQDKPIKILFFTKSSEHATTRALGVYEAFKIYIIASLIVGLVLASPVVAYQLWSFVAAGLYPHEKKYVYYFIPVSIALFLGGALFAFFFVFQFVLDFLFGFNAWLHIEPDPRITEWIGFALLLPIGFGISFQLPVVMFVLERVGIFRVKQYIEKWKVAILAIFVLALFLTPGDPGSMLLMAFPLTLLYFGGVLVCWLVPRKQGLFDFEEEPQE